MPTNPQTHAQPATQPPERSGPRKLARKSRSVESIVDSMRQAFTAVERSMAGYNALMRSYQTITNTLPENEPKRGLPLLSFKATANGVDSIDVCVDLRHINPQHIGYVLPPMIHAQGHQAQAALTQLVASSQALLGLMNKALAAQVEEEQEAEQPTEGDDTGYPLEDEEEIEQ